MPMTDEASLAINRTGCPQRPTVPEVRLAIVGSRKWTDAGEKIARWAISEALDRHRPAVVISGGAAGVDTWTEEAAKARDIPFVAHLPERNTWPAYKARNLVIAQDCTHLVSIRSALSTTYGSGWTADQAEKLGKTVERITIGEPS